MDLHALQAASLTNFFAEALDGAMALVRADGGEIATLDESRQVLVLRARRTRPRLESMHGTLGAPARNSQPVLPSPVFPPPYPASNSLAARAGSLGSMPGFSGIEQLDTAGLDDQFIDEQSTQLLPAMLSTRTYRRGERLLGYTWEVGDPVILRGEECRALPSGSAPADPEAAWHLAVPILRPGTLSVTRPSTDLIGVIAVYNRDPLWSFSAHDMEMLSLHADRVARAMQVDGLARQNQGQSDLLNALASDLVGAGPQSSYTRLRDLVRGMIDAPSLAIVL